MQLFEIYIYVDEASEAGQQCVADLRVRRCVDIMRAMSPYTCLCHSNLSAGVGERRVDAGRSLVAGVLNAQPFGLLSQFDRTCPAGYTGFTSMGHGVQQSSKGYY